MAILFNPYYNAGISGAVYGCVDSNGNLWTTNGSNAIYITSASGVLLKTITPPTLNSPQLVADSSGHVYVSCSLDFNNIWIKYDITGAETISSQLPTAYNNGEVNGLGSDGSNVYFVNSHLYSFNFASQITTQLGTQSFSSNTPLSTTFCSFNNTIWVHDVQAGNVYVLDILGNPLQTIPVQPQTLYNYQKIMLDYDPLTKLMWMIWPTQGGGTVRLAIINPTTYAIVDRTSLITGYNPACIKCDGNGGIWISSFTLAGNNSHYVLRIYNNIVSVYTPTYESHLQSGYTVGIVLYDSIDNLMYIPSGAGNYITSGTLDPAPTVVLNDIIGDTNTSVTVTGQVTVPGDGTVTARGTCWGLSSNPTITDDHTTDATDTFSSTLTPLVPDTIYYVRTYATNEFGTAYSAEETFKIYPHSAGGVYGYSIDSSSHYAIEIDEDHTTSPGFYTGMDEGTILHVDPLLLTYHTGTMINYQVGGEQWFSGIGNLQTGFWSKNSQPYSSDTKVSPSSSLTLDDGTVFSVDGSGGITCTDPTGNIFTVPYTVSAPDGVPFSPYLVWDYADNILYVLSPGGWSIPGSGYSYWAAPIINNIQFTLTQATPSVTLNSVTAATASAAAFISSAGLSPITERGVCYSETNPTPTISDLVDVYPPPNTGHYNTLLTQITGSIGTTYHVRAYAKNIFGITYSNEIDFTTVGILPTVVLNSITDILGTRASAAGDVTYGGDCTVIARGMVWNRTGNPTLASSDGYTTDGAGIGSFASSLTPLTALTHYYVCAYAENLKGISYSQEADFMTYSSLPILTTSAVSNITDTTVVCGGSVLSQGDGSLNDVGLCWNAVGSPTIADNILSCGTSLGLFTGLISGLIQGVKYCIRAYAANAYGVSYGNQVSFSTTGHFRTSKIIHRVLENIKDPSARDHHFDTLIDRLNTVEENLCRDFFAFKSTKTLSLISGQKVYTVDPAIFKIKQIYTPSGWRDTIEIITSVEKWNQVLEHSYSGMCAYLWNGILTLSKAPSVSVNTSMDVYSLPSIALTIFIDPEINSQWDKALEYGVTKVYDPGYEVLYQAEARSRMDQNIKESIQGTQFVNSEQREIWNNGGHGRWHLA